MIIDQHGYAAQRTLSRQHVEKLASLMRAGEFLAGSQFTFGLLPDGRRILVNGYHRAHAIISAETTVEVVVTIIPVANETELNGLYYRLDSVQRTRSTQTIILASGLAEEHGVSPSVATAAYHACSIIANGLTYLSAGNEMPHLTTPDGRFKAALDWWPTIRVYSDALLPALPALKRRLINPSVMAVALVTLRYCPEKAIPFWSGIAANSGLERGDARLAYVTRIQTYTFKKPLEALAISALAWNHYHAGTRITYLRLADNARIAPNGTPYANRSAAQARAHTEAAHDWLISREIARDADA